MIRLTDAFEDLAARATPTAITATDPSRLLAGARAEAHRRNRRRRAAVAGVGVGVAAALTAALGFWSDTNAPGVETRNLPVATAPPIDPLPPPRREPPSQSTNPPSEPAPAERPAPGAWSDDGSSAPPVDDPTWSEPGPMPPGTTTSTTSARSGTTSTRPGTRP
jgi:hypothetical protein